MKKLIFAMSVFFILILGSVVTVNASTGNIPTTMPTYDTVAYPYYVITAIDDGTNKYYTLWVLSNTNLQWRPNWNSKDWLYYKLNTTPPANRRYNVTYTGGKYIWNYLDSTSSTTNINVGDLGSNHWIEACNYNIVNYDDNSIVYKYDSTKLFDIIYPAEGATYTANPTYFQFWNMYGLDNPLVPGTSRSFCIYLDKKDAQGTYQQYSYVNLTDCIPLSASPADWKTLSPSIFAKIPWQKGDIQIRFQVDNNIVLTRKFTINTTATSYFNLTGIDNNAPASSQPPTISVDKHNFQACDLWYNGEMYRSYTVSDIFEELILKASKSKIGDNKLELKARDGTVLKSWTFTLFADSDGNITPSNDEVVNGQLNKPKVDANGKPIAPTGINPLDWIKYYFNMLGYYVTMLFSTLTSGLSSLLGTINSVGAFVGSLFSFMPEQVTVAITTVFFIGCFFFIVKMVRG